MLNKPIKNNFIYMAFLVIYFSITMALIGCNRSTDKPDNTIKQNSDSEDDKYLTSDSTDTDKQTAIAYARNSHLKNKSVSEITNMSVRYGQTDILFSKWLETENLTILKYCFIDLDGDNDPETVLWLAKETNEYLGFVILHEENETVYFYLLYFREFYDLKTDGTFSFSGGVANNGIRKISFSGLTYTLKDIAYRESYNDNNISYIVEGESVSQDKYGIYLSAQEEKADAVWNVYH